MLCNSARRCSVGEPQTLKAKLLKDLSSFTHVLMKCFAASIQFCWKDGLNPQQIGADKTPKSLQAVLAVAPLKKGKQLGNVRHFVCLSVCPVQFVFTELQSGSNLLLGVHSKPKSCENSGGPDPWGTVRIEKIETVML